jgi:hypothetical protein
LLKIRADIKSKAMETTENIAKKGAIKNILLTVFGVGALSAGYLVFDQVRENHRLHDQLDQQNLQAENNSRAFQAIETNLAQVTARAGVILNAPDEKVSPVTEERIISEIETIDKLVGDNNRIIKNLTATLGEKDERIVKFKKLAARLDKRLKEYKTRGTLMEAETLKLKQDLMEANRQGVELQKQVSSLKQEVASDDADINAKEQMIGWQSDQLEKKDAKIRTAYYVVGTYKDLHASNVVEKTGGFIGLGRTKMLKKDFDRNTFHQIDIYSYTSIPVFGGHISILTNHSSDSYELKKDAEGNVKWIYITDPEKFWENSKYLVVQTNDPMYEAKPKPVGTEEY